MQLPHNKSISQWQTKKQPRNNVFYDFCLFQPISKNNTIQLPLYKLIFLLSFVLKTLQKTLLKNLFSNIALFFVLQQSPRKEKVYLRKTVYFTEQNVLLKQPIRIEYPIKQKPRGALAKAGAHEKRQVASCFFSVCLSKFGEFKRYQAILGRIFLVEIKSEGYFE